MAIFGFSGTSHTVVLFVWSSNAEIKVSYTSNQVPPGTVMPTRAAQLAAAIAIAGDLLAGQFRA